MISTGEALRLLFAKDGSAYNPRTREVERLLGEEKLLDSEETFELFKKRVYSHRGDLLSLIRAIKQKGELILGYGASTKGNVILQFCGLTQRELNCMAEVNPEKYGRLTPGTWIPIISEEEAHSMNPDYFLVMPWHFKQNLLQRESNFLQGGGKLIFPLPEIEVVSG